MSEDNCQTLKIECGIDKYFSEEVFVSKLAFSTDAISPDTSAFTKKCQVAPLQMKFSDYLGAVFDQYTKNFKPEVVVNILERTNFNLQKEALDTYSDKIYDAEVLDNLDITRKLTSLQQIMFYKQCCDVVKKPSFEKKSLTQNQFLETVKNRKPSSVMHVTHSILYRVSVLDITVDVRLHIKLVMCPENISLLPSSNVIRFVPTRPLKPIKYVKAIYSCNDAKLCDENDSDSEHDSDSDSELESEFTCSSNA